MINTILLASLFYIWYEEDGTKHISTVPRHCITKNHTITLACQQRYTIHGDHEVAAAQRAEQDRIERGWAECGEPGRVYVGDTPANKYLDKFDTSSVAGSLVGVKVAKAVQEAEREAHETCQNVHLSLEFDQKAYQEQMRERQHNQSIQQIDKDVQKIKKALDLY